MKTISILIVEDEIIVASDMQDCLEGMRYRVSAIVDSGQSAVEQVGKDVPDLIIMDVGLRGEIDGIETARRIQDITDAPVIFVTAYSNREAVNRNARAGDGYLVKPFDDRKVREAIETALKPNPENKANL